MPDHLTYCVGPYVNLHIVPPNKMKIRMMTYTNKYYVQKQKVS